MTKNPKAKGQRRERQAEERLHEDGWETVRPKHSRFGDTDFFNLFDIIAVKPGNVIRFIQVKCNEARGINQFAKDAMRIMPFDHCHVEFWVYKDYYGWWARRLNPDSGIVSQELSEDQTKITNDDYEWIELFDER